MCSWKQNFPCDDQIRIDKIVSESNTSGLNFNPFAPGDFAEKRVLKLVKWFSGHYRAIKS